MIFIFFRENVIGSENGAQERNVRENWKISKKLTFRKLLINFHLLKDMKISIRPFV